MTISDSNPDHGPGIAPTPAPGRIAAMLREHLGREIMLVILVALCIVLALVEPAFLSTQNLLNVLRIASITGVIAFGMTMVIISGEIDLSVGSAAAFAGCLAAVLIGKFIDWGLAPVAAVILAVTAAMISGIAIGAFTGCMRVHFRVPTFITTLALLAALRGGALLITGGFPVTTFPDWFLALGNGAVLGIPVPTIVLGIVFISVHVLMNFTTFGRAVYAIGGNAEAARLSGIRVAPTRIAVLGITGFLAALAGVMLATRIGSGTPTVAEGMELDVIAAVIIGGTSLFGGAGRVWGTLVGLVFIGVIANGMTLLNVPADLQYVVRGGLILLAVLVNQSTSRLHG